MPDLGTIDRYRLLGELGRGAMGTVYRAHDPRLDREVAVKMIGGVVEPGTAGDELQARFEREARVAARLRHPNVVAVHDAGRDGDRLFVVFELVDGESLQAMLARGACPERVEALEFVAQAAEALAAAHAAGIVHRDIKPGNLLVTRDGRLLVTDFGIAKALGETSELTRTGMVVGSPAYLSPEQVQGLPLDGRSDIFSLGVVLFELVLRRKPFAAETFTSLVYQILTVDPLAEGADLHTLPPALAELLRASLAKDREHRIADARLFASRARGIAQALPRGGGATAPTLVLSATGRPTAAPPPAPVAFVTPGGTTIDPVERSAPKAPSAPSTQITAVTAVGAHRSAPSGRGRMLFAGLIGAVAVAAIAGVAFVLGARRPLPPAAGAPPAAALEEAARPLAQPEPPPVALAPTPVPTPAPTPVPTVVPVAIAAPAIDVPPAVAAAPAAVESATPAAAPPPAAPAAPAIVVAETFETSRAAEFHVSPEDAIVTIEGVAIGKADDWDGVGGGREVVFPRAGSYLVRLDLPGYQTTWIRIVVRPGAKEDVVDVDTDLEEVEE